MSALGHPGSHGSNGYGPYIANQGRRGLGHREFLFPLPGFTLLLFSLGLLFGKLLLSKGFFLFGLLPTSVLPGQPGLLFLLLLLLFDSSKNSSE